MRTKSSNVQIKNLFDDISSQIETMSSAQAQIGKSTYYYTKQAAKTITGIEGMYAESQEAISVIYLLFQMHKTKQQSLCWSTTKTIRKKSLLHYATFEVI